MPEDLLSLLQDKLASLGYARRTKEAYELWIHRFFAFHQTSHLSEIKETELNSFLIHLATVEGVSPSSQHQASSALIFLCRHVLGNGKIKASSLNRIPRQDKLPLILCQEDVEKVLRTMSNPSSVVASLLYGSGLRLMEALQTQMQRLGAA